MTDLRLTRSVCVSTYEATLQTRLRMLAAHNLGLG